MSLLFVCIVALAGTGEAATSCAAPTEAEASSTSTSGAALLQLNGKVAKGAAPADSKDEPSTEQLTGLQQRSEANNSVAKKPSKDGFDFGGGSLNNDNNNDNLDTGNNNNNNLNTNNNDNNNLEMNNDVGNLDVNNNNANNFDFTNNDKDKKKNGDKDKKNKGDVFNFGNNNDNNDVKKDTKKKPIDNFDFGDGPIKDTDADVAKAAMAGLKKKVEEVVAKLSSSLSGASAHDKAVREALEHIMASPIDSKSIEELKKIASIAAKAEGKVQEAQEGLKELKTDAAQSAARLDSVPRVWLLAFAWLSFLPHLV